MRAAAVTTPWRVTTIPYTEVPAFGPRSYPASLTPPDERQLAAAAASEYPTRDRAALAEALRRYNSGVGNTLDATTLQAIAGDGVFVIAGQQPGLLLGPMYTLLKAASAVCLARRLAALRGRPVIPAFWIASEDHDIEEVNRAHVDGRRIVVPHEQVGRAGPRPAVAHVSLQPFREMILDELRTGVNAMPFGGEVVELVSSLRFDNYAASFADLLARLMGPHGLVLVDPMSLRELAAPVMARFAEQWPAVQRGIEQGGQTLRARGFTPPLDHATIFRTDAHARQAVEVTPHTPGDILAHPHDYSPSAALRPIVQDALLPTLVTLGGPSELMYLRQIEPLYPRVGATPSMRLPRASATFVDVGLMQRAHRMGLGPAEVIGVAERLAADAPVTRNAADDADIAAVEAAAAALLEHIDKLKDSQSDKVIDKARESMRYQAAKVVERVRQQRLEAAGAGRRNLQRIADAVYPAGKLQERITSPMEMLARFGMDFVEGLVRRLDPLAPGHQLVQIGEAGHEGESH